MSSRAEHYLNEWHNKGYTGSYVPEALRKEDKKVWVGNTERRFTDSETGGQKGEKEEEYSYIPSEPLAELARVYGKGAKKYEPWNWSKGYPWRLSYSALFRHIEAHRRGESLDPDSGLHHLAHAAFHLFTLIEFERLELGTDDRWTT